MKRLISIVLATAVMCALAAFPALAAPPARFDVPPQGGVFPFAACPGFVVMADVTQSGTGTTHFDNNGAPVMIMLKMDAQTVFYSSANPGRRLVAPGHWTWLWDVSDREGVQVGPIFHLVIPGLGTVLLDAGLVIFESGLGPVKISGMHPLYNPAQLDLAALCAALE